MTNNVIPQFERDLADNQREDSLADQPVTQKDREDSTDPGESLIRIVRRVTGGTVGNVLGQVINVAGQFVLVPIFLTYWGSQLYGEWLTLSAAVAYLTLVDFGIQSYVINRMNQCYVRGELEACSRILHSALYLYLLVSAGRCGGHVLRFVVSADCELVSIYGDQVLRV